MLLQQAGGNTYLYFYVTLSLLKRYNKELQKKASMKTIKVYLGFALLFISANALSAQSHTQQSTLPCLDKTFSVVVHIAIDSLGDYGITTDEIEEKIEDMNAYFAPICAKFKVCEFRYIENYQYDDIIRTPILYE